MLVVDDEALFRQGLIHLVRNNPLGWEVVGEAADGEEAIQAVHSRTPDLIITDINMPVMDGLDLAERIHESGLDIMIIILTGYREFEYAQRAIRYGAIEFLLKPFSLDEACQVLQKAHERYRRKQSDIRIREQYSQVDRTERLREELTLLPPPPSIRIDNESDRDVAGRSVRDELVTRQSGDSYAYEGHDGLTGTTASASGIQWYGLNCPRSTALDSYHT